MFTPEQRQIFAYKVPLPDGTLSERFADPLQIRRALLKATQGELFQLFDESRPPIPQPEGQPYRPEDTQRMTSRFLAQEKLDKATREAFGLPGFDTATGQGMTEGEVLSVLLDFTSFMEGNGQQLKKTPIS